MTRLISIGLFVCVNVLLAGCASALVGGGATGESSSNYQQRSSAQINQDARIASILGARLRADSITQNLDLTIETYNAVVTVYGRVSSRAQADRVVYLARAVRGVQQVISKISVSARQ